MAPNWTLEVLALNVDGVPAIPAWYVKLVAGDWSGVMAMPCGDAAMPVASNVAGGGVAGGGSTHEFPVVHERPSIVGVVCPPGPLDTTGMASTKLPTEPLGFVPGMAATSVLSSGDMAMLTSGP
jgi:hypothetical protein